MVVVVVVEVVVEEEGRTRLEARSFSGQMSRIRGFLLLFFFLRQTHGPNTRLELKILTLITGRPSKPVQSRY
jgi:recombinational DNA repair protein (RecF pathway)